MTSAVRSLAAADQQPLSVARFFGDLPTDQEKAFADSRLHRLAFVHGHALLFQGVAYRSFSRSARRLRPATRRSRIAASLAGSAKPSKVLLATIPGGGTSPTREPAGKSRRPLAPGARIVETTSRTRLGQRCGKTVCLIERDVANAHHAEPLLTDSGQLERVGCADACTRRKVRLIRPPSGSKRDVPG